MIPSAKEVWENASELQRSIISKLVVENKNKKFTMGLHGKDKVDFIELTVRGSVISIETYDKTYLEP